MAILFIGLLIFFAVHSIPMKQGLRANLVGKFGELPYKAGFSVVALVGLVLIIMGKGSAPFIAIWNPPYFMTHATKLLMIPALIFLAAAYVPCNIKRKLKHPMLVAIKTWALGHLLANGDAASMLLFLSFLAFAIVDRISLKRRPVSELPAKPWYMDLIAVVVGLFLYVAIAMHHAQLFGVPAFAVG